MKKKFHKYHGSGNDFILIDNREKVLIDDLVSLSQRLCQRHYGIGSDGLILIESSEVADFNMAFYNPDGSQSFCGNGSRCAMHFANELGLIGNEAEFSAIDGKHLGRIISSELISVKMKDVQIIEKIGRDFFIDTGSPHYVVLSQNVDDIDLITEARKIRYNSRFEKEGSNVNFIERAQSGIKMRTYERGVENETLSCGTGVTAAALTAFHNGWISGNSVAVKTKGGNLEVKFGTQNNLEFNNIWLTGPVKKIYQGEIEI